jgi:hypothetical protein
VVDRLRDGCAEERLSLETFAGRVGAAYQARSEVELYDLVADLPVQRRRAEALVERLSRLSARLRAAWAAPRIQRLELPERAPTIVFGRARGCDCVLVDATVSRRHALLRYDGARWWLRDIGSSNGTLLNGRRVIEEVEVHAGDVVCFAATSYRLMAPRAAAR